MNSSTRSARFGAEKRLPRQCPRAFRWESRHCARASLGTPGGGAGRPAAGAKMAELHSRVENAARVAAAVEDRHAHRTADVGRVHARDTDVSESSPQILNDSRDEACGRRSSYVFHYLTSVT